MIAVSRLVGPTTLTAALVLSAGQPAAAQPPEGPVTVSAGYAASLDDLRRWDAAVDALTRAGGLVVVSRHADRLLEGRVHEHLAQVVGGVRVIGAGIARQLDRGVTVSLAGTVHRGIDIDTTPVLSAAEAGRRMAQATGAAVGGTPELVVLPLPDGSYAPAYRAAMSDLRIAFADAADGRIVRVRDARRTQSAVGTGVGVRGDRKKVAATRAGGRYEARDRLRPGEILTLDARFDESALDRLLVPDETGAQKWTAGDIADDEDNDWNDRAVVDHHVHVGWTYDFFNQALGWNGLDGRDGRILGIVNVSRDFANAFFVPPPFGPEGTGAVAFGELEGEPMVALDVVAHELTHGVIFYAVSNRTGDDLFDNFRFAARLGPASYTDRQGRTHECATTRFETIGPDYEPAMAPAVCIEGRFLLASSQASAIHEAYADIMAEAAAFFHAQNAGTRSDYLQGSDEEAIGVIRSLRDPRSLGHPAAYGERIEFALVDSVFGWDFSGALFIGGAYAGTLEGGGGYGAGHWNSLILSHAYYLAIEGGTNAATGLTVAGAGDADRRQIEQIFFRALSTLMPAETSLPQAADAIRQSAADLAPGSPARRAVEEALRAVGLPPDTTT